MLLPVLTGPERRIRGAGAEKPGCAPPGTFLNCWYTLAQTFSLHEVTEMPATKPDWTEKDIAVGRGATFQQWVATVDKTKFEMDVRSRAKVTLGSMD